MHDREHERVSYAVTVGFRSTSSFLFAYSVNLSRGGMFLEASGETMTLLPGAEIEVHLTIDGEERAVVQGRVSWRRDQADGNDPPGIGVEFHEIDQHLGDASSVVVSGGSGCPIKI